VIIILPVFPAGQLQDTITLYMIKYHFRAISREGVSILEMLEKDFPDVDLSDYISFHCLRNWGNLHGEKVTEHIYIHSKVCIVDDRVAIVGSANINDRSLRGTRDSELAVYLEESSHKMVDSQMNGKSYKVSAFVRDFRMRLWRDFLGLSPEDQSIEDPVCQEVYRGIWLAISRHNTKIYRTVFEGIPDNILKLSDLEQKFKPKDEHLLQNLQGYLVDFPLDFLRDEKRIKKDSFVTLEIAL